MHEQRPPHLRVTADVNGIRVRPSERLVSEVEKICGTGSVSLVTVNSQVQFQLPSRSRRSLEVGSLEMTCRPMSHAT